MISTSTSHSNFPRFSLNLSQNPRKVKTGGQCVVVTKASKQFRLMELERSVDWQITMRWHTRNYNVDYTLIPNVRAIVPD